MKIHALRLGISICLILISAGPTLSQSDASPETTSTAPVADLYIQTLEGVMVYSVSSAGAITEVTGSRFYVLGQMEAINGKYLISVGTELLHTYKIESNGAVGEQVSSINTHDHHGSQCGMTSYNGRYPSGSFLDHTGKYFYVQIYDFDTCDAWQSYRIGENGSFTFLGDVVTSVYDGTPGNWIGYTEIPTVNNTDKYAYSFVPLRPFEITPSGALKKNAAFTVSNPEPSESWGLSSVAADPDGHLAVVIEGTVDGYTNGWQLASYTIDPSTGGVSSTNTPADMPLVAIYNPSLISMSYSGSYVAVGGYTGLEVYHFNGAAPPTPFSGFLLPNTEIDQLSWDTKNHLYALSYEGSGLYVYTATPTTITEVAGYPVGVPNAFGITGMIVVPK
jgi:hypothetical protein